MNFRTFWYNLFVKTVLLTSYTSENFPYLSKWLVDKELMHNWGMPIFKKEDIGSWIEDPTRVILMIRDDQGGNVIGFVNFYNWDKNKATASMGILIDPKYQNQGYGKIAIKEVNNYAFDKLGLKKIELYVESVNQRSRHVMEKAGYIFDHFNPIKQKYFYYMAKK